MGAGGSSGGPTDPGSAREEAERLVAAALAMARSAASGARERAGTFGPLSQVISDVLGQVTPAPQPTEPPPGRTEPWSTATTDPWSAATTGPAPAATDPDSGPSAEVPPQAERPAPAPAPPTDAGSPVGGHPPTDAGSPVGGHSPTGAGFATGGPECCVCPVCRSIAALRDPSPEFAERLATGAGDFAAGVASLLRAFSAVAANTGNSAGTDGVETPGAPSASPSSDREDAVWREATRTRHDSGPADEQDVWAAATRTEVGTQETGATADPDRSTSAGTGGARSAGSSAAGRPPVPASRTPEGPVTAGPGEQAAPDQGP